ncbi:MAG: RBBP9/YdeN family alpha/beta hydrolase [Hyphomicrobium sp.]
MTTTLIIPGLKSSGPAHWQTWFEEHIPGSVRVIQRDWNEPNLAEWASRVRREISRTPGRLYIAAHSFGVLAAVQAAADLDDRIAGALLVAPADPEKFAVADYVPAHRLNFPSVVVASTNDAWMRLEQAAYWADLWGSDLVNLGAAGHINVDSGFGPWPEGLNLLERLKRAAEFRAANARRSPLSAPGVRRRALRDGLAGRTQVRTRPADERRDLNRAAALLEEAGWQVAPPVQTLRVARL